MVEVLLNTMPLATVWRLNQADRLHVKGTVIPKGFVIGSRVGQPRQ